MSWLRQRRSHMPAAPSSPPAAPGRYWAAVAAQATASTGSGVAGSRCAVPPWSAALAHFGSPPAKVPALAELLATLKNGLQNGLGHDTSQPGHLLLHWVCRLPAACNVATGKHVLCCSGEHALAYLHTNRSEYRLPATRQSRTRCQSLPRARKGCGSGLPRQV